MTSAVRAGTGCLLVAVLAAGCASSTTGPPTPIRKATPTSSTPAARADARAPDSECSTQPPSGELTDASDGLSFRTGSIHIRVQTRAPAGASAPADTDGCFAFPKWGNVDAVVPVESALFVFSDSRSNGAQIEMSLPELVSRRGLVSAQVSVATRGRSFQAASCSMRLSMLTAERAGGEFTCPNAVLVETNPFFPSDDIAPTDQAPESSQTATPTAAPETSDPAAATTAALSGWFEVSR